MREQVTIGNRDVPLLHCPLVIEHSAAAAYLLLLNGRATAFLGDNVRSSGSYFALQGLSVFSASFVNLVWG